MYIYINIYICCKSKYISEIRDDPNVVPYVLTTREIEHCVYVFGTTATTYSSTNTYANATTFNPVVHNEKCICTYLHMYFYFNIM